jgi:hypothetical protein
MISPDSIPSIPGDMAELTSHAYQLTRTGAAIATTGAAVHQGWQTLAAVYRAPEADQLLAATGPVMTISASVGEDIQEAAATLRDYAADTAVIQTRFEALRLQATELVTAYAAAQDESTTVRLDDRSAELTATVSAETAAWEAVQLRCANALRALTGRGDGTDITPREATGPLREIFPIDGAAPISTTGNPPIVLGPGLLVTVPGLPSTGVVDSPGSYPPAVGFGPVLDRTTAGEEQPPGVPAETGAVAGPVPAGDADPVDEEDLDFEGTGFSKAELVELVRGHSGDNNPGAPPRPTITEIETALDEAQPRDIVDENNRPTGSVAFDHQGVRVIVNRRVPLRSTSYYPRR